MTTAPADGKGFQPHDPNRHRQNQHGSYHEKNNLATALLKLEFRPSDVHASLVSKRCATFQAAQMVKTRKITTRQQYSASIECSLPNEGVHDRTLISTARFCLEPRTTHLLHHPRSRFRKNDACGVSSQSQRKVKSH